MRTVDTQSKPKAEPGPADPMRAMKTVAKRKRESEVKKDETLTLVRALKTFGGTFPVKPDEDCDDIERREVIGDDGVARIIHERVRQFRFLPTIIRTLFENELVQENWIVSEDGRRCCEVSDNTFGVIPRHIADQLERRGGCDIIRNDKGNPVSTDETTLEKIKDQYLDHIRQELELHDRDLRPQVFAPDIQIGSQPAAKRA